MRFVVFGAGAVGGVIGGRMTQHGHDVLLIARGRHYEVIRQSGLRMESPGASVTVSPKVVDSPDNVQWTDDDVVLLTVKTQQTMTALNDLVRTAPSSLPVVCVQNGVENERLAARRFANVYGICVMCPTSHLEPGVVQAWSSPLTGILDIGKYPSGVDVAAQAVARALSASTFESQPRPDIMRWKSAKLLMNLGNAVAAICGPGKRNAEIVDLARQEGEACFRASGVEYVSDEEDRARRGDLLQLGTIAGRTRSAGSSWQSLQRQTGNIEADYFNGEIVLLGRQYGIATPVNALLQRLANRMAHEHHLPGSISIDHVLALL